MKSDRRREIIGALSESGSFGKALLRLSEGMRRHVFETQGAPVRLNTIVERFDRLTRADGFHVLNDWDGQRDALNETSIPVDVLIFLLERRVPEGTELAALAILLDYYFFYILALFSLRVWDEGDAEENLDRVEVLLEALQGPDGSGHHFVASAETLPLVATSHFEPDTSAYDRLLQRVKQWNARHRTRLFLAHAAILSSHLRFGFQATYGRDLLAMREDNVPDYPWLLSALLTLVSAYDRLVTADPESPERRTLVEGLLCGLAPDPRAFVGKPPASLSAHADELERFRELFDKHKRSLVSELETLRPSEDTYSPLSFFFNFPHNLLKAMTVDALLKGEPCRLGLNDLLTGVPPDSEKIALASTMTDYARKSPDRIRGRLVPVIVYDPRAGRRVFADAMRRLS